jgi:hypothetical protein
MQIRTLHQMDYSELIMNVCFKKTVNHTLWIELHFLKYVLIFRIYWDFLTLVLCEVT